MRTFRLALAQINPTVGDLDGNTGKIVEYIDRARDLHADMVAFPELAIPGYPPEDLLFKPQFIQDNIASMREVAAASAGIAVVVGFVDADSDIFNAAAIASDGELVGVYRKMYLRRRTLLQSRTGLPGLRRQRHPGRRERLRGHLVRGRALGGAEARGGRSHRQYQRLALLCRKA